MVIGARRENKKPAMSSMTGDAALGRRRAGFETPGTSLTPGRF
jgi:hypothetical protein